MSTLAEGVDMDGMGGMGGIGMIWMLVWGLLGIALLVVVVVGVVWLARRPGPSHQGGRPETPEDILRRRYAAGELDEDEYLRRRAGIKDD